MKYMSRFVRLWLNTFRYSAALGHNRTFDDFRKGPLDPSVFPALLQESVADQVLDQGNVDYMASSGFSMPSVLEGMLDKGGVLRNPRDASEV